MLDLSYYMPTRIFYGEGCVAAHKEYFAALGKRCLIVTGKHSAKASGALDDVTKALDDEGITYEIFDQIPQNPLLSVCKAGGDAARQMGAEFIVGIGGGSPLDASKAVSVFASNEMAPEQIFDGNYSNAPLPLILVGTTAGTGSEVTPYAVLSVDTQGETVPRKRSVRGLFANACFCDYRYTMTLDYGFTIATALDALSHCIEGYFSKKANTISDEFAKKGAKLIVDVFQDLSGDGTFTRKQREKLYAASIYGGLTITQTGTCYCHAMGYFLTEDYHIPHGIACAVYLPSYLQRGCEVDAQKADALLFELEEPVSSLCSMIENVADFKPLHLTQDEKNALCERWTAVNKFATSPGEFTVDDAMDLVEDLF
ncbi:MAG: iron-containing alcohol dehydrogenase family protein [Massiliimalia sp.]|jgi:alcohol dehydrogenase